MTSDNNTFDELKAICHDACRERKACTGGYAELLRANTPTLLFRTWMDNWCDVWRDRYPDIINRHAPRFYKRFRTEANSVGLWINECAGHGRVIVTDSRKPIAVFGDARAYVVGSTEVHAYGNAAVYNHAVQTAIVVLHDYSHGYVDAGVCTACDRSHLQMNGGSAACYDATEVMVQGGTLRDHGHRRIDAMGCCTIVSDTQRKIYVSDQQVKLLKYNEDI